MEGVDALAEAARASERMDPNVFSTVFYGAAGYDLLMAARFFRFADVIFGFDDHPFAESSRIQTIDPLPGLGPRQTGFVNYAQVDFQRVLAPALISNLLSSFPNVRILGVWALTEPGGGPHANGWIKFDAGPGTRERHLIQIQSRLRREDVLGRDDGPMLAWALTYLGRGPFAHVLKGSQYFSLSDTEGRIEDLVLATDGAIFDFDGVDLRRSSRFAEVAGAQVRTRLGYGNAGRRLRVLREADAR